MYNTASCFTSKVGFFEIVPSGATYNKSCQVWRFDRTLLELPYTQLLHFSERGGQWGFRFSLTNQAKIVPNSGIFHQTR